MRFTTHTIIYNHNKTTAKSWGVISLVTLVICLISLLRSCYGVSRRLAVLPVQDAMVFSTKWDNLSSVCNPNIRCLPFRCRPCLGILACLYQILQISSWQNDSPHPSSSGFIFRHKPCRKNIEPMFKRHWCHWRAFAQDFSFRYAVAVVRVHSSTLTVLYELLAVSRFCSDFPHIRLLSKVLPEQFPWAEEMGVCLPQSCLLTLHRDHDWLGHNSYSEKGKRFHRSVVQVSIFSDTLTHAHFIFNCIKN